MKVTIKDIAAKAGVSVTTVSFVINGKLNEVSSETAQLVMKTIDECGYVPNVQARNLQRQRSGLVALFVPDLTNPYYTEVAQAAMNELGGTQFKLALMSSINDLKDDQDIRKVLGSSLFDGCLIVANEISAIERYTRNGGSNVPCVLLDASIDSNKAKVVTGDNVLGGEIAANFLLENNHSEVVCISGPKNSPNSLNRLAGFLSVYSKKGISIIKDAVAEGDYTFESGYTKMGELIDSGNKFSAVFCLNDLMALGAMQNLKERNIRVPEDVSIIGYDNSLFAKTSGPRLTTVDQRASDIGSTSIKMLIKLIEKKKTQIAIAI